MVGKLKLNKKNKTIAIPKPTVEQKVQMLKKFTDSFGRSYTEISKESLALMILNQTANITKTNKDAVWVAQIGLAMKRQRDWFHKLCREKNGK
jgi:hypothetical protein